jgi:hypothetical protein
MERVDAVFVVVVLCAATSIAAFRLNEIRARVHALETYGEGD